MHLIDVFHIGFGTSANPPKESLLGGFPSRWTTPALLFYEGKRGF
jgi:hypothetical protein